MLQAVKKYFHHAKYGPKIVVVSGLPRSGTSMMMNMLQAGGMQPVTDELRVADVDNPKGYFEDERVKDLEHSTDKAWIREARGKVLKVISFLLKDLPEENAYQIIFMRRDLDEILASQNKMIVHRGASDTTDDESIKELYRNDIARARVLARRKPNVEMIEVKYRGTIEEPRETAAAVNAFLGGILDEQAMANTVDASLYRNKRNG